ncbi:MAG: hypothetical protein LBM93_08960 [Oscillospiraceae bacterium]|jgi:hypothetical protein|nr:hypothetical protein [Oscillospiraceae bacterium]
MKSKKFLAGMIAASMVVSGGIVTALAANNFNGNVLDAVYSDRGTYASLESISNATIKKLVIPATIGELPVTQFNIKSLDLAEDLASFGVSGSSASFKAKGVALARYEVHNNGKLGKDYEEWTDYALLAYPNAGPKTFTLTKDIVAIGDPGAITSVKDEDIKIESDGTKSYKNIAVDNFVPDSKNDSTDELAIYQLALSAGGGLDINDDGVADADYDYANPFTYAPKGMTVYVPTDHPTFVVYKGSLYTYYWSEEGIVQNADGSFSGQQVKKPGYKVGSTVYSAADGHGLVIETSDDLVFKMTGTNSTTDDKNDGSTADTDTQKTDEKTLTDAEIDAIKAGADGILGTEDDVTDAGADKLWGTEDDVIGGAPAEGTDGAPAEGTDGTPAEGTDGAPAEGDGTPAEGTDGEPTADPGDGTAGTDENPTTGTAGVGVALAALLATGSTAIVLKKRGRRD